MLNDCEWSYTSQTVILMIANCQADKPHPLPWLYNGVACYETVDYQLIEYHIHTIQQAAGWLVSSDRVTMALCVGDSWVLAEADC